jgi:hypothetical protein
VQLDRFHARTRNAGTIDDDDALLLLESEQDLIHAVASIPARGIDPLHNAEARRRLGIVYLKSEAHLRSTLNVLGAFLGR